MEADVQTAFGNVYKKIDADSKETRKEIKAGFKDITEQLKENQEVNHKQDLAIQNNVHGIDDNKKNIDSIKKHGKTVSERKWEIAKPFIIRAIEVAIFASVFFAYLYFKSQGG